MTKKKPEEEADQGDTGRPVSGGGTGGKTRSKAEDDFRKEFDRKHHSHNVESGETP